MAQYNDYRKAYQANYRKEHSEKNKAYQREYYRTHKEESKEYYKKNEEKLKAQRKARDAQNPEAKRGAWKKWFDALPEERKAVIREKHIQRLNERYKDDPEYKGKIRTYQNEWRKEFRQNNPEVASSNNRRDRLNTLYDLTPEDFERLYDEQKGFCPICKNHFEKKLVRGNLVVDHCHKTNQVRGLLCSMCNSGLGFFGDNIERLKNAINYLENFTTTPLLSP